jgi:hypothetical protein
MLVSPSVERYAMSNCESAFVMSSRQKSFQKEPKYESLVHNMPRIWTENDFRYEVTVGFSLIFCDQSGHRCDDESLASRRDAWVHQNPATLPISLTGRTIGKDRFKRAVYPWNWVKRC